MIQGHIVTSTRSGRGKRRRYIREIYLGKEWKNGIHAIRSMLHRLPKGSKGVLSSMVTGRCQIITKRTLREV